MMTETAMLIEDIRMDGRHRKDLGDLTGLTQSIKERGLINPVTVTEDGRLLAGGRRLAVVRALGHKSIAVRVVETFGDAAEELRIERDENTERIPMTPSELVSLGKALEELERPKTAGRIAAHGGTHPGRSSTSADIGGGAASRKKNETRSIVASALGTTAYKYETAKRVVAAANDPAATEEERTVAEQAVKDMDAGRVTVGEALTRIKSAALGPRQRPSIDTAREQRKSIARVVELLENVAQHALPLFAQIHPDITKEEAARWADSLFKSRADLSTFINALKEYSK